MIPALLENVNEFWTKFVVGFTWDQVILILCGGGAVYLSQDKRPVFRKYACIVGLFAQPFWFYTAWVHNQSGALLAAFIYSYAYFKGFKNFWIDGKAP
jgi:hypothetical protein